MKYYITADLSKNNYKDTAVYTASEKQSWVDNACLSDWYVDSVDVATGEPNTVNLDGSYSYFPTNPSSDSLGWWSNQQADVQGNFATPINIRITPSIYPNAISSVQIDFGDTLPSTFVVEYYNIGTSTTVTHNITPTESKTAYSFTEGNIAYVDFGFTKMQKPYAYLKINEISLGRFLTFDEDNSTEVKDIKQLDLLANSLPISSLTWNGYNENNQFYSLNPNGLYSSFKKNQTVKIYTSEIVGGTLTRTPQGTYYLTEWEDSNAEMASFSAECAISLLDNKTYNNGLYYYGGIVTPRWIDCFEDVFSQSGLTNYTYQSSVMSDLGAYMQGIMPTGSIRDVLRDLLMITRTAIRVRKGGDIYIYSPDFDSTATALDYYFDSEKITTNELAKSTAVILPKVQELLVDRGKIPLVNKALTTGTNTLEYDLTELSTENDNVIYVITDIVIRTSETDVYYLSANTGNRFSDVDLRQNQAKFKFNSPSNVNASIQFQTYSYIENNNVYSIVSKNGTTTSKVNGTANATNIIDNLKPFFFAQCSGGEQLASNVAKYWQSVLLNKIKRNAEIKTDADIDLSKKISFETSVEGVNFAGLATEIQTDYSGGLISDITIQGGVV